MKSVKMFGKKIPILFVFLAAVLLIGSAPLMRARAHLKTAETSHPGVPPRLLTVTSMEITDQARSRTVSSLSEEGELYSPDEIRLPLTLNTVEPLNKVKVINISEAGEIPHSHLRQV